MVAAALLCAAPALAQRKEPAPKQLDGVGVDEHLAAQLPMEAAFRDSFGKARTLGSLFSGERPLILSLNYSDCPMLCNLQLTGLVEAMRELDLTAGRDFDFLSISIDPREQPARAQLARQKYLKYYERPGVGDGFHFLVGDEESIRRVTETVGFHYRFIPERNEFAHTAAAVLCTPDGRISRYLYGVEYPQQTLRLSLVEAGEGKIGTTLDQVLLFCFHYDADAGRYGPAARNIMKVGGAVTLLAMLALIAPYWWRKRRPNSAPREMAVSSPSSSAGL